MESKVSYRAGRGAEQLKVVIKELCSINGNWNKNHKLERTHKRLSHFLAKLYASIWSHDRSDSLVTLYGYITRQHEYITRTIDM